MTIWQVSKALQLPRTLLSSIQLLLSYSAPNYTYSDGIVWQERRIGGSRSCFRDRNDLANRSERYDALLLFYRPKNSRVARYKDYTTFSVHLSTIITIKYLFLRQMFHDNQRFYLIHLSIYSKKYQKLFTKAKNLLSPVMSLSIEKAYKIYSINHPISCYSLSDLKMCWNRFLLHFRISYPI